MRIFTAISQKLVCRSAEEESRTLVHAAEGADETHGQYLDDCRVGIESKLVLSEEGKQAQKQMWTEYLKACFKVATRGLGSSAFDFEKISDQVDFNRYHSRRDSSLSLTDLFAYNLAWVKQTSDEAIEAVEGGLVPKSNRFWAMATWTKHDWDWISVLLNSEDAAIDEYRSIVHPTGCHVYGTKYELREAARILKINHRDLEFEVHTYAARRHFRDLGIHDYAESGEFDLAAKILAALRHKVISYEFISAENRRRLRVAIEAFQNEWFERISYSPYDQYRRLPVYTLTEKAKGRVEKKLDKLQELEEEEEESEPSQSYVKAS
ncbi:uncharacterized protein Z518_10835 [Rhinocladiella mackenziei CBS 650.93]|uniref:Uncharacterized protein n=1 Tax=Rhinocladiella mackenziei CBS 650.93 TaxID=1442369 RepID=A0A0D2GNG1_9EURO|nr:uncharacterized protein Z518_10835 [Rhinocladiella mackenziei CBS 650.93]KIW99907.1 hypothetical protein Z518_10835 [Rhinocladiella mackenziei CBS 650.93]